MVEQGDRSRARGTWRGVAALAGHHRAAEQTGRSTARGDRAGQRPDRVAARTQRPAAHRDAGVEGREDRTRVSRRDVGSDGCRPSRDQDRAVEGAVRQQERAAEEAGLRSPAWPAARRRRPWSHPTARAGGQGRRSTTLQPIRALAPVAESPMSPTAPIARPSPRSMSRLTRAESSVPAGAGRATVRRRPGTCRRPHQRACSPTRPTG